MKDYEIDVSKLDRAEMIQALYNATSGVIGLPVSKPMTLDEAKEVFKSYTDGEQGKRWYIDYLRGRSMKIHFGKDILDTRLFDRDNGQGAAAAALKPLLENGPAQGRD